MRRRVRENQLKHFIDDIGAALAILNGAVGNGSMNRQLETATMRQKRNTASNALAALILEAQEALAHGKA